MTQLTQEDLVRRRKLLEALTQGGQPEATGKFGWATHLANAGDRLLQARMQAKLAEDETAYQKQEQGALGEELKNYLTQRQGRSGSLDQQGAAELMFGNSDAPVQALPEPVQANPRAALEKALSSRFPQMQQIGMADMASMGKPAKTAEHVVNGNLVRTTEGQPGAQVLGTWDKPQEKWTDPYPLDANDPKSPTVQKNTVTGQLRAVGTGGTTVNVDTGKGTEKRATEIATAQIKDLGTMRESAMSSAATLDKLTQAELDFANGVKSGITADIGMTLAKIGQAFGMEVDPTVANTESFRAQLANLVYADIKNLGSGTGVSNTDLLFAKQGAGADPLSSPEGMLRLIRLAKTAHANKLAGYEDQLGKFSQLEGVKPADVEFFRVPFNVQMGEGVTFDTKTGRWKPQPLPGRAGTTPVPGEPKSLKGGAAPGAVLSIDQLSPEQRQSLMQYLGGANAGR